MRRIVTTKTGDKFTRDGADNCLIVLLKDIDLTVPEDDEQQYAVGDEVFVGPAPEYKIRPLG